MFKEVLISVAVTVICVIILSLLRKLSCILSEYLSLKKAQAQTEGNKAMATAYDMACDILDSITKTVVYKIEATKAYSYRNAVKKGQRPVTDLTGLSDEAYEEIINQITPKVREALESGVIDLEVFIRSRIEAVLPKIKADFSIQKKIEQYTTAGGDGV